MKSEDHCLMKIDVAQTILFQYKMAKLLNLENVEKNEHQIQGRRWYIQK